MKGREYERETGREGRRGRWWECRIDSRKKEEIKAEQEEN